MKKKLELFATSITAKMYWFILALSFIAFIGSNVYLGILFENTGYPVPLIEGQLRFDESLLKQDFSVLIQNGTIEEYKTIQYLDLSIMLSTAIFFGLLTLFIFRKKKNEYWRMLGLMLSLLFPLSGLMDFIENIWLLNMLESPTDFASWKAIIYSSFALLKLLAFVIGLVGILLVSILSNLSLRNRSLTLSSCKSG